MIPDVPPVEPPPKAQLVYVIVQRQLPATIAPHYDDVTSAVAALDQLQRDNPGVADQLFLVATAPEDGDPDALVYRVVHRAAPPGPPPAPHTDLPTARADLEHLRAQYPESADQIVLMAVAPDGSLSPSPQGQGAPTDPVPLRVDELEHA